jgi:hypothetical protein
MKRILKFTAILLILAGSFSCGEDEDKTWEDIPVEYVKCPCEREVESYPAKEYKDILMLDVSKTTYEKTEELLESEEIWQYLLYDPVNRDAYYSLNGGSLWQTLSFICNFPFQFNWEIPSNGIRVSFTCDVFKKCEPAMSIPEMSDFDIVLTSLKIKR